MNLPAMTGREVARRVGRLDVGAVAEAALVAAALRAAQMAALAGVPGGEVEVAGTEAVIGWRSPALPRRERGDVGMPPNPVLARIAAGQGADAAAAIGAAVADSLRGT